MRPAGSGKLLQSAALFGYYSHSSVGHVSVFPLLCRRRQGIAPPSGEPALFSLSVHAASTPLTPSVRFNRMSVVNQSLTMHPMNQGAILIVLFSESI
jgi:hypothetical protein